MDVLWRHVPIEDDWTIVHKNDEIHVKHGLCGSWMHANTVTYFSRANEPVVCDSCGEGLPVPKKAIVQILMNSTLNKEK